MIPRFLDAREDNTHLSQTETAHVGLVADHPRFLRSVLKSAGLGRTARRFAHWAFVWAAVWAMIVPAPALFAASITWNGTAGTGLWSTGGNWIGGAAPGSTSVKNNVDTAVFNGTESAANTTITIDSGRNVMNISFDTTNAKADTIGSLGPNGGNSLFLTAAGTIQITSAETNAITETINAPLLLEGSYTIADNSTNAGSNLIINGNLAMDAGTAAATLTFGGTAPVTDNGVIANGGATLAVTKNGAGTLFLAGANTYTGATTLSAGVINLGSVEVPGVSGPLGKSAAINANNIVLTGGTLQYSASNQFDYSGRFSTTANQQYRVDINGQNITWASNLTSTGGAITLTSTVGGGTLTLSGNNSFTGSTQTVGGISANYGVVINGGTFQVGSNGALNYNQVTNTGVKQNVAFGSTGGTFALNGFNVTLQDLEFSTSSSTATSSIIENGGSTPAMLTVNPSIGTTQDNIYSAIIDGGAGSLGFTLNGPNNAVFRNGGNTFSGPTVINGGVLTYLVLGSQGNTSGITINSNGTATVFGSATGPAIPLATMAPLITPSSTGTFGLSFQQPDSETINFGGPVLFGAGSGNFSTFNGTMNAVVATGDTKGYYRYGGGGVGQLTINSSGGGGPLADGPQQNGVVVQGILKAATGSSGPTNSVWNTLSNGGLGGNVINNANFSFTPGGTIELQGQNTYSGDTLVNVASTQFPNANDGSLSILAVLQVNNSSLTSGGQLVSGPIGRSLLHISAGGFQDGGLPVVLNNSVMIDPKTTTYTVNGSPATINGPVVFSSYGNGTMTFNGVGVSSAPTFTLANTPYLIVKNISTTISDNISGTGFSKSGIGNLILDGNNTFTGNITITAAQNFVAAGNGYPAGAFNLGFGGVQFNSPAAIGNAANTITVNAGAFAAMGPSYTNINSTFLNRIAAASTGTIALTANTADNLDFSGLTSAGLGAVYGSSVTYSGSLNPAVIAGVPTYRLGGGGGTLTYTGLISGTSAVSAFDSNMSGTLILGGANTYTGNTTVSGTNLASYFNPGVGNNANPGESRSQLQLAGNSSMNGTTIASGPLGLGTVTFIQAPAIEDNGTNILVANNIVANSASNFNTAFTSSPIGFNSAGNGSLTFDGGPSATISLATTAVGNSLLVNNFTTIKDALTGTQTFSAGNQFFTISGTGTLQLSDQGTLSYTQAAANGIQNTTTGSTLLLAGPTLRFGSSSSVSGGAIANGPLGKGPLVINGAGSIGSFLQDNGTNITIANAIGMNLGNPVKFDSTGAGSITFDGTGVTSANAVVGNSINIFGTTTTLTLTADNTVIVKDRIVGNGVTTAVAEVLNIGTNVTTSGGGNAYPYGTVVLSQPSGVTAANPGSTFSGGVNLNYSTLAIGASSFVNAGTLVSGPLGTGRLTMSNNFAVLEDNGSNVTIGNNVTMGNSFILQSLGGSITFDPQGQTTQPTVTLNGSNNQVINGTLNINDLIWGNNATGTGNSLVMGGSGKLNLGTPTFTLATNMAAGASTFTVTATTNLTIGQTVSAAGLPAGTIITAITGTASPFTVTLSNSNTGSANPTVTLGNSFAAIIANNGVVQVAGPNALGAGTANNVTNAAQTNNFKALVNFGGTLAAGPNYTGLQTSFFNVVGGKWSAGTLALTNTGTANGQNTDNYDWSAAGDNVISASLGAVGGTLAAPVIYSGMLTPNGTIYRLGGGGGVLRMDSALTNSDSLIVGGGGTGGTVILNGGAFTGNTYVNLGNLQLNTAPGAGSITVAPGGGIAGNFSNITANLLPLITANSSGVVALPANSSENLNFSAIPNMGLGSEGAFTYSGTLTPVAGSLRLGGGGGTLTVDSGSGLADSGGPTSVVAFGGGSGGTLILRNDNTFSGGLTLLPGVVITPYYAGNQQSAIAGSGNAPAAGTLRLMGSSVSASTGPVGGGTLTLAGGNVDNGTASLVTLQNNVNLIASTSLTSSGGGSLSFTGAGATFTIANGSMLTVSVPTTISDAITGSTGLTKAGAGTLTLAGANTYSGPTNILNGTVQMLSGGSLPSGTTLNIGLGGYLYTGNLNKTPGTLDLFGTSQSVNGLAGTGIVTNNGGSDSLLTIGASDGSSQFYGTIQDGATNKVAVAKSGAGVLVLGSSNTYSGGTTVNGGTLRLAPSGTGVLQMPGAGTVLTNSKPGFLNSTVIANGPVGTGTLTLGGGATLQDSGYATNLANSVSVNGAVTFSSPSASSIFGSPNSGSLVFDGTALTIPATFNLSGSTNLAVNNMTTIADQITGGAALSMSGSGTLILSSTTQSTYTTMTANSGVVQYNAATAVGSGPITINNGGTVAVGPGIGVGGTAGAISTPIGSFLPFVSTGSTGTLALTGNDSEAINMTGYANLSLGATGNATFSGTLTPNSGTYMLGGGGGTLTFTPVLSGGSLVVGGNVAGGGSGGTVLLTNALNINATVNSGTLTLSTPGSGSITVNSGGAVAAAATYDATNATNTPLSTSLLPKITSGSAGTLALTGTSSENLNFSGYQNLSLGAAPGAGASYSGTVTPAIVGGTQTYRLGGGGGTLTFNSAIPTGNLVVNGSGSTGTVALGGTGNSYNNTNVVKGTLRVGPNSGVLGSGTVTLGSGSTLALTAYSAPLAATGWNYDTIVGLGESSAQGGVTASFGDGGAAIYQHGLPGSQQASGNMGLPASRSMVGLVNNDSVYQLQPYNQNNTLKLGIGTNAQNAASYSPQGTLTLKNPGQYQALSILDSTASGNTFFEVQANFADGTSVLVPNTTNPNGGNLPNYYAPDWNPGGGTTGNYNVNTANYQYGFLGAGLLTIVPNNGTFAQNVPGNTQNSMATPHPLLWETDIVIPNDFVLNGNHVNLQNKTLTSVTFIYTGGFNGANNSADFLHATSQMNIMALSGTLVGGNTGAVTYNNAITANSGSTTIDMQNAQGVTFNGGLTLADAATLNVTNSLGSVSTGAVGPGGVQPFTLTLGGDVALPTTGSHTATFNVQGPGEVLSVGQAQAPVTLKLGPLDDGNSATPATINVTGGGTVVTSSFVSALSNPQVNVIGGGNLVVTGAGLGFNPRVNVASGSTVSFTGGGFPTVSQLSGAGSVLLNQTSQLVIGVSPDNLNNAVSNNFTGDGSVQNGGSGNTLTLNGGNFANTVVNSNSSATVPAVVAGNTMALGNSVTLNGSAVLRLMPTPGTAVLSGFGNNYGIPDQNGYAGTGVVSNGWTINSNGFIANGATGNTVVANNNVPSGTPFTIFPAPNVLHLTNGGNGETRTAFYNTPVPYANGAAGFTASFTYTPGMQAQADGMTFILQNDPYGAGALGGTGVNNTAQHTATQIINQVGAGQGAYKGYGGIANSIAIELDVFQNGSPGGVGTALAINGSNTPISLPVKWLADGDPINVTISYSPTSQTVTETLVDTLVPANVFSTVYTGINLGAILGKPTAYVGFGGATGGQYVDQLVSNFNYSLAATTPGSYASNVALNGSATIDLAATAGTPIFSTTGGLNTNGGTLTLSASTAASSLNYGLTFNGPSALAGTVSINALNAGAGGGGSGIGTVSFASRVSGAGGITNVGPGTVVLGALNTFTGGVTTSPSSVTAATAAGALSSGLVTLAGGTLKLSTSQPYSAPVVQSLPIAATGWNQDGIVAANQNPAAIYPQLDRLDGGGISQPNSIANSQVLYQTGATGSPPGTGLPANGVIGDVTTPNAFNPNVTFQLQPYSTPTGGLVNNLLQVNSANLTGTLTLATPAKYNTLSILSMCGSATNGEGSFEMQLNFADAPPLMVGSGGGANSTAAGPGILTPDWFNNNGSVFPSSGTGRYGGGTNFNGTPANPRMYEYDYTVPLAYQNATLESITFEYGTGGQVNIFAVSGTQLATSTLNPVSITADSTIDVTGTSKSGLAGATTIGSSTLHVTGGSTGANVPYTLSVGTVGGVTLNGNPIFDVANNGSGVGNLALGALNDQGTAKTLEFSGSGQTTLGTAATSLIQNTIVTIDPGATLNSNAGGTSSSGGSLGQFAQVSVGAGATFSAGASQTISSLASASGTSKAFIGNGVTLGVGNTDNISTTFAGQVIDLDAGHPGSLQVGITGSTGSLALSSANNTYHGTTTVSGGTLLLQAASNNIANSSTISVLSGGTLNVTGVTGGFTLASGQTLQGASVLGGGGGGTVNGAVGVGANATIAGTSTTPSTSLTVSVAGAGPALTLQGSSTSSFALQASLAGSIPLITTSSGSDTSLNITGANQVNISSNSILPTEQSTFRLYSYSGPNLTATGSGTSTLSFTNGGGGSMAIGSTPPTFTLGYGYVLSNQPGHIDLVVTPNGLTWAGVNPAGSATPDTNWTTSPGDQNWASPTAGNPATNFTPGSQVIFSDNYPTSGGPVPVSPSPQNVMIQAGGVSTAGVTFGAQSVVYTFTGADATGITGSGGLNFVGTAPVTFGTANSFTGPVLISTGQLNLGDGVSTTNDNALGAATGPTSPILVGAGTGVTVSAGATLNLKSVTGTSHSFGNSTAGGGVKISLALSGSGSGNAGILGALNSQSGNNTYAGPISIGSGGATIGSTSTALGDGLTLSGGINNTILGISSAVTLAFAGAGNTTVNSAITDPANGSAPLSIALAGPGNLILTGNNSYHGATTDPGLLVLGSASALGNSSSTTVSSTGGLVLINSGATALTMGSRQDATGTIPLSLSGSGTNTTIPGTAFTDNGALTASLSGAGTGALAYAGPISVPANATISTTASVVALTLSGNVTIGTGGAPETLTFVGAGNTTLLGTIADTTTVNNGTLVIATTPSATAGSVIIAGNDTYSGTTSVNTGTLILQSPNALGNTPSVTVASNAALVLANNATFGKTVNTSTPIPLSLSGAGTGTGFNGIANGSMAALMGVGTVGNTYTGPITINSAATIGTSISADILTLSGAINSTGATTTLTGPGTINVTGGLNINVGTGSAGLVIPAVTNFGGTNNYGGNGTYNVSTKSVNDGGTGGTIAMSGTGTLNLNTFNNYTGGTTVGGGTAANTGLVVAGNTLALGSGAVTLNGGILRLSATVPGTSGFPGTVNATGQAITGWTVNNTVIASSPLPAANTLQLTDSNANEARTAWFNTQQPVFAGFTSTFTYTPSAGTSTRADGATFTIQNATNGTAALGGAGGALGYGGITPSVGFEINIYNPNTVGTTLHVNGATGGYTGATPVDFNSGDPINVTLVYNPATTTLTETDVDTVNNNTYTTSYTIEYAAQLGSLTGFIGFTGATGGSNSTQQIKNFTFTAGAGSAAAPVYRNNVVMNAGTTSTIQVGDTATAPTITVGNLTVNSGSSTLNVAASGTAAQNYGLTMGSVSLNGNPTFNVANNTTSGTGTLTLGALNDGGVNRTITVNGAGNVLLSTVATSMGSSSVINVGGGSGSNGNLVVTNATGSPTGTAAINMSNGGTLAGTFPVAGTGSIAGLVTVSGGGTILGSNVNALAGNPLIISGNLTLAGGNSSFSLSTTPNGPPTDSSLTGTKTMIAATGGLTVNGANLVKLAGSAPTNFVLGQNFVYDLFSYAGTLNSNASGTTLTFNGGSGGSGGTGTMSLDAAANLPLTNVYAYSLKNDAVNHEIEVVLTPSALTWTGQTNGNGAANSSWDTTQTNWANSSNAAAAYFNGAAVVFADKNPVTNANVTTTTVTIAPSTGVQPGIVIFKNTGTGAGGINYTIGNAAGNNVGIGGAAAVTLQGNGTVGGQITFAGANSFSGALTIGPGQLNLADAEPISGTNYSLGLGNASSVTVNAGATLLLQGTSGAIRTFGQGYNATVGLLAGSLTTPIPLTLNGAGLTGGALNSVLGNNTYVGAITLGTGGATIASTGVPGTDALTLSGAISDGGVLNPGSLTIAGAGVLNLTVANSYYGATTIGAGTTVLSNALALGNSSGASVASGATLALTGGTAPTPFTYGNLAAGSGTIGLTLNGAGVTSGPYANLGALVSSGVNSYTGPVTLASNSTIATTAATDSLSLTGNVTGSGLLTVVNPGTVTLSGINGYSGGTTFNNAGTLVSSNVTALGTGTVTLNTSGTTGILRVSAKMAGVSGFGGTSTAVDGTGTSPRWFVNNSGITSNPINNNVLTLTDGVNNEARSAWYNSKVAVVNGNDGFTALFTYQPSGGGTRADGITFTMQTSVAGTGAIGAGGGGLGYSQNDTATGVAAFQPSVAWELNIYNGHTIGTNFVNGAVAPATLNFNPTGAVNVNSGDPIRVLLHYDPATTTLSETDTDTVTNATFSTSYNSINIPAVLGSNTALIGFTGATGGLNATQLISNFEYGFGTLGVYTNNVVLNGGLTSTIDVSGIGATTPSVTMGTFTVGAGGAATLNVTDTTDTAGLAYALNLGATTLNSSLTVNVANAALGANGAGTLSLGPVGEGGGSRSITKIGVGTLILSGTGTYSGGTSVSNGTLNAAATNALGTGSLDVSTAGGNVSVANIQANNTVTALTGTVAGGGSATVNVSAGQTLTVNQTAGTSTFAGNVALAAGATPGTGGTLSKSGGGTEVLTGVPALGNNSNLQVSAGLLKFNVASGTPNVGSGVAATISGTGSIELAGAVSVLGVATPAASRVNINNSSSATNGLLVSSTTGTQQVGGITGTGTTGVNASASLTANHIIQGALVIGGSDASHLGLVTIDASDASGNPLSAGGGAALTGSLEPSTSFGADAPASSSDLASSDSSASGASASGASVGAGSSASNGGTPAVPEPSTIVMVLIAAVGALGYGLRRRNRGTV